MLNNFKPVLVKCQLKNARYHVIKIITQYLAKTIYLITYDKTRHFPQSLLHLLSNEGFDTRNFTMHSFHIPSNS